MSTLTTGQAKAYYDSYGARQESQAFYEDAAFDALIAHSRFEDAKTVFEFGCGTGRFASRLLSHHLPANATYEGIDISETMVDLTTERLRPWKNRASISQSDGRAAIPASDQSLDRVITTFVMDLLSETDTHALIDDAHRALRPDGFLCLASLDGGTSLLSRLTGSVWRLAYRLNPLRVGGCRPVDLPNFLPANQWQIEHQFSCARRGVSFTTIVARPR